MKIHLKFDHDSDETLRAIDCPISAEELNDQIEDIVVKFTEGEKYGKVSQLAEAIHNEVDYSAILYMATKHAFQHTEKTMIKKILKDFLDEDETI